MEFFSRQNLQNVIRNPLSYSEGTFKYPNEAALRGGLKLKDLVKKGGGAPDPAWPTYEIQTIFNESGEYHYLVAKSVSNLCTLS